MNLYIVDLVRRYDVLFRIRYYRGLEKKLKDLDRRQVKSELEKVTKVLVETYPEDVFTFTKCINKKISELKNESNQDYELALLFRKKRDYLYDALFKYQIPRDYLKEYKIKEEATSRI